MHCQSLDEIDEMMDEEARSDQRGFLSALIQAECKINEM
jgi:hypothetical protein